MSNNQDLYIYCRVSTSGQEKDGSSLDVQEERGIKLSKKLKLNPIVIKEQGSGLKPYSDVRPKFTELVDQIVDGTVKNVWVDEKTRLTRNDMDEQFVHIQMKQKGVNLYYGNGELKKWDWMTDLVDTIITKVNQEQIKTMVRKSGRSKERLFKEGCYMKGSPPFGYDLKDKKLVPHSDHKDWVVKIFEWYDQGKSTVFIRQQLFQNDIKPPLSKTGWFPLRSINVILTNKNYIGVDTYGDLTNECPKLVKSDLFDKVQKKINKGISRGDQIVKTDFLVRGLIKCTDGSDMTTSGRKKNGQKPLYVCNHRKLLSQKRITSHDCTITRNLRSEWVDSYIWNLLVDVLSNSHQIKETTKQELLGKDTRYTKRTFNNKIKNLNKKMVDLDNNQMELDKRFYSGDMDKKKYEILSKVITEKEQEIMDQIQENQMKLDQIDYKDKWVDWLEVHFQRMDDLRRENEFDKCRSIVQHYLDEIVVLKYEEDTLQHTLSVKFKFPLFEDKFEWLKNKDGSYKLDKFGRRRYKVLEGKSEMINPTTLQYSLNSGRLNIGGWCPYLVVYIKVISHKFSPSPYYTHKHHRKSIHNRIKELRSEGLGYRRIHRVLTDEEFEIGESPTTVDSMIKKMDRRNFILKQRTEVELTRIDFQMYKYQS